VKTNYEELWTTVPMYCPNCGTINDGYRNSEGKIKYECPRCGLVMVRTYKNRRHDLLEITIPEGMARLRG
jgi:predicted RNA-binding Zn-ribbon protein involved in translation (DUF1610 family)